MTAVLIIIITILIDQATKYGAIMYLQDKESIVLIDNFFKLNYLENYGAAWGILKNQRYFFIIITILVIIILTIYAKLNRNLSKLSRISMSFIIGGAIGNLIDRMKVGYVIDFLDINFGNIYDFPVFNFADSFIVIGTFLMMYLVLSDKYEKQK